MVLLQCAGGNILRAAFRIIVPTRRAAETLRKPPLLSWPLAVPRRDEFRAAILDDARWYAADDTISNPLSRCNGDAALLTFSTPLSMTKPALVSPALMVKVSPRRWSIMRYGSRYCALRFRWPAVCACNVASPADSPSREVPPLFRTI